MSLSEDTLRYLPLFALGFLAAAVLALALTPLVRRYAHILRLVDRPEARRVNTRTIARGGGVAFGIAFIVVTGAFLLVDVLLDWRLMPRQLAGRSLLVLLGGGTLAVGLGLLDDRYQLRARWQFLGQLGLAVFVALLGVNVTVLNDPFGGTISLADLGALGGAIVFGATLFWVVGMINAINFIAGLDGLSSGIGFIAALTLGVISVGADSPAVAFFCFVLAGSLLGFLRWNFHPASIFAGTSGIMFLGYTLAALSILGTAKVAVALLVLGVPIIDAFWIIVRRVGSGRSPFSPDRGHIHHRLLDLGLSHRNTVLVIYAVCLALAGLSLGLSGTGQLYAFLGLVVIFGLALLVISRTSGVEEEVEDDLCRDTYDGTAGGTNDGAGGAASGAADIQVAKAAAKNAE